MREPDAVEATAREETWSAYRRWRNERRLCEPGPIAGSDRRAWDVLTERYWGKAVGIVPAVWDWDLHNWSSLVLVGVCYGVQNGGLGRGLAVEKFSGPGVTTYRPPDNLDFIHELGGPWQRYVDLRRQREEEGW